MAERSKASVSGTDLSGVAGSNPAVRILYGQRVRVVKECDSKSHGLARAGSNPAAVV